MIAEFMLRRTKAEQVAPIYNDFLKKYPNLKSLSSGKIEDISKFTLHLGLHWRAADFINACKFIEIEYDGIIPDSRKDLLLIPGIGEYVAGAILTICFKKPEFVIDSNIARFINRYYGLELTGEIRRKKVIIEKAKILFNIHNPDKLLFSMLDFTALVCKPRNPECFNCILNKKCSFFNF
jgi:A/G-specific adenine glycosylase